MTYESIYLVPQYSEIASRKEISTSTVLADLVKLDVPLLPANMDSLSSLEMCVELKKMGNIGTLHRFMSIEENVSLFYQLKELDVLAFCSLGVNGNSFERFDALHAAGNQLYIVDIAHGHCASMRKILTYIKQKNSYAVVMAGNVGTREAVYDLEKWGADIVKVGIGAGKACVTRNVTGVYTPMVETLIECVREARVPIVADGGIREIGDICKALALGASAVMSGYLFAHCREKPMGDTYRGMASAAAMQQIRDLDNLPTTPEGISLIVEQNTTVKELLTQVKGGLQSSFSYANARNLRQFQAFAKWKYLRD